MSPSLDESPPQGELRLPRSLERSLALSHLPALDALRAFSAFLVVFYHAGFEKIPGGLGVLAFFVLSGFLITWLLLKEHEKYKTVSLRRFYVRRSLRIFPAFYAYWIMLAGALWWFHKRIVWPQAFASFFYVNNYYQALRGDPDTGFSHTWSLGIEEQFYLIWPAAFLLLAKNARALRPLAAVVALVWIWRVILFAYGTPQGYFYEAFDTRLDALAVGCALAVALRSGAGARLWTSLCDRAWKPVVTLLLLVTSVVLENTYGTVYRDVIGLAVNPLLVAALIVQWIALSHEHPAWRWLNQRWLIYLGTISYSTYLYQQLVPDFVKKALPHAGQAIQVAAMVAVVILAASASYLFIERPFLRLKDRLAIH